VSDISVFDAAHECLVAGLSEVLNSALATSRLIRILTTSASYE